MRISEALELARQSIDSFEARLKEFSIKELYELTDNLRFANNPEVFSVSQKLLIDRLVRLLKRIQDIEKGATAEVIDMLHDHVYEKTGFSISSDILPSAGLKQYLGEIISWSV